MKSPLYPNPLSDYGYLDTYYTILADKSDSIYKLYRIAYELMNEPYIIRISECNRAYSLSFINVQGEVIMENIKKCHDTDKCILVRIYNPINKFVRASIKPWIESRKVFESDILESDLKELSVVNGWITLFLRPFEIKNIKIYY